LVDEFKNYCGGVDFLPNGEYAEDYVSAKKMLLIKLKTTSPLPTGRQVISLSLARRGIKGEVIIYHSITRRMYEKNKDD